MSTRALSGMPEIAAPGGRRPTTAHDRAWLRPILAGIEVLATYLQRWPLPVLAAVTAALNLTGIWWGLPNADNDWAIDSVAPLGPLSYAESMLYGKQWWSKYPPLHFSILAIVYAPYVLFLVVTGGLETGALGYPYGLTSPTVSLPLFTLMARTVSAVMGVGTVLVCYRVTHELTRSRGAGLVAGLVFAGSPLTVYYAHTANLDIPYMFWSSLAMLFLVQIARGAGTRAYVLLGGCVAAAIATKDQAYGLFLLMPALLLAMALRAGGHARITRGRLAAGLAASVAVYALAANVIVAPRAWLAHVQFITQEGSQPYIMFPHTLAGYGRLLWETGRLVVLAFDGPLVLLALIGLFWACRSRLPGTGLLVGAAASYVLTFLVPILYVLPRFVLPLVFVLAVFAGGAAAVVWRQYPGIPRAVVVALVLYAPVSGLLLNATLLRDSRYAAEEWMRYNLPVGSIVGLDGAPSYLPRLPDDVRGVPVEVRSEGAIAEVEPEFIVLSEAHYRRYLRHERRNLPPEPSPETIERLLAGDLGYAPVATFYSSHPRATRLIPGLSPRIMVLRRVPSQG